MNYLAHLLLSGDNADTRLGGILGDFYKGPLSAIKLKPEIVSGIHLHRKLDAHSDQHPGIKQCVKLLGPDLRRTGGIVIDIVFDHFLAKHWPQFSQQELKPYCRECYQIMNQAEPPLPAAFLRFRQRASEYDLLASYAKLSTIELVLDRVALRLSQPQRMAGAFSQFEQNIDALETIFLHTFPELQDFCRQQLRESHG